MASNDSQWPAAVRKLQMAAEANSKLNKEILAEIRREREERAEREEEDRTTLFGLLGRLADGLNRIAINGLGDGINDVSSASRRKRRRVA